MFYFLVWPVEHCPFASFQSQQQQKWCFTFSITVWLNPPTHRLTICLNQDKWRDTNSEKSVWPITVRKNVFDPLLILYVCHFNARFMWTVRDRITRTKIQKNTFENSYKLICILMSEISIWPLCKTWLSTWWQNPCWQSQRSDVSCSLPPGLHTSQEGFCPTSLCRSSPSH